MRKPVKNVKSHPADGKAWKEFDRREPTFAADPRNLRRLSYRWIQSIWQHEYPVQYVASASDTAESPSMAMRESSKLLYVFTHPRSKISRKGF
jgi:hypothetical protein